MGFDDPIFANDSQQDVNYNPDPNGATLKGGSGNRGSAVGYPALGGGPSKDSSGSGRTNETQGFVGTRHTPDEDEE